MTSTEKYRLFDLLLLLETRPYTFCFTAQTSNGKVFVCAHIDGIYIRYERRNSSERFYFVGAPGAATNKLSDLGIKLDSIKWEDCK